jgi:putative salt-induced outer membrane protein YdiY
MKKTEDSLRRYKKGKKSAFSLFGNNAGSKLTEDKDEERVRVQMVLDVEALGQDAKSLGVEIELSAAYVNLLSVAGQFDGAFCF